MSNGVLIQRMENSLGLSGIRLQQDTIHIQTITAACLVLNND
jgi:hypothetical protein